MSTNDDKISVQLDDFVEETATPIEAIAIEDWRAKGTELFGPDILDWKFQCPACGHVATGAEYKSAGAPLSAVGFSCVGRWNPAAAEFITANGVFSKGRPCNYAGGGLFRLNPVPVRSGKLVIWAFEFGSTPATWRDGRLHREKS